MDFRHEKSPCCGAPIRLFGGTLRQCTQCSSTWRIRPKKRDVRVSAIPWRELIGTRHRLVHGYDAVGQDILWAIVADDFSPLAAGIKVLLND